MHGLGTSQMFLLFSLLVYISVAQVGSVNEYTRNAGDQFNSYGGGYYTNGVSQYSGNGFSKTVAGDVTVYMDQSSWKCDRISCPTGTDRCQVTKGKSPEDATKLIRENKCLDANGSPLVSKTFTETIGENEYDNLTLTVTSSGASFIQQNGSGTIRQLTPEEAEELNRKINHSIQKGQETLRKNLQKAREAMDRAFKNIPNFGNFGSFGSFW